MERIIEVLNRIKPDVNFKDATDIVGQGLLSSMDIMNLVVNLNMEFEIKISIEELRPENFKSVETIKRMVDRMQNKG